MSAPSDLHDALAALQDSGWQKSMFPPGIWRPVGRASSQSIRPDVPGSGVFVLRGDGLPVGGFRGSLDAVVTKARELR